MSVLAGKTAWREGGRVAVAALLAAALTGCGDATMLLNPGGAVPQTIVLQAESLDTRSVRLQWSSAGDRLAYQVERNGATFARVSGLTVGDANLRPGQQYCYRVYAYGGFGRTARSNEVCIGTDPDTTGWRLESLGPGRGPAVAVDAGGEVHVCHARAGDGIVHRRVAPGRATQIVDPEGLAQCSVAVASSGVVHIAYLSRFGLRHASNAGGTWAATTVDAEAAAPTQASDGPALALDADERPRIAYRRIAGGGAMTVAIASRSAAGWSYDLTGLLGLVGPRSLAIDAAGRNSLALIDLVGQAASLWTRGASGWTLVWQQGLAPTRGLGAPAVIDATGHPATAWWRQTVFGTGGAASLTVATRGATGWREEPVAETDGVGYRVALTIDGDEALRVAWVGPDGSVSVASHAPGGWTRESIAGQTGFAESTDLDVSRLGEWRVVFDLPLEGTVVLASRRP